MPKQSAGNRSEYQMALFLGGKTTLASGATSGDKSDIKLDWTVEPFRAEHKSTQTLTLSVKKAWLDKIIEEARHTGRIPLFTFSFTNGRGVSIKEGNWVAMRAKDWLEMMERLAEAEDVSSTED